MTLKYTKLNVTSSGLIRYLRQSNYDVGNIDYTN